MVVLPISRDLLHPCAGRLLVIVGTSSGLSGSCRDARGLLRPIRLAFDDGRLRPVGAQSATFQEAQHLNLRGSL